MSSSAAICAICFEEAWPIFEDLQSIPACGHVFHEPCLQQWMEYCPAGRDPTCPLCKRSISGPAHDVHRLYFQSAGSDSAEPQVSQKSQVSRILQAAVEDLKHVNCSSEQLESKLAAAMTIVYALESQVAVNLQMAEKAEAATVVARSELAQCRQDLTNIQKELMCLSLKLEKMQEEIGAMKKVLASHEQARWDRIFGLYGLCVKRIGIFLSSSARGRGTC